MSSSPFLVLTLPFARPPSLLSSPLLIQKIQGEYERARSPPLPAPSRQVLHHLLLPLLEGKMEQQQQQRKQQEQHQQQRA